MKFNMDVVKVSGRDINSEKDLFLGETSVQIIGFNGYPSVHIVQSYVTLDSDSKWGAFYHIFSYRCGTSAVNYNYKEYLQVKKFISLSKHWQVFFRDLEGSTILLPLSRRWEEDFDEGDKYY